MKTVEYFEVSSIDGPHVYILANFSSEKVAQDYAQGKDKPEKIGGRGRGFYGKDAQVTRQTLVIADTIEEQLGTDADS